MKKFFTRLLNIKAISVVFAIALWYYVIGIQGPIIQGTFSNVPVLPINVPSGSFVVNNIGTVSITAEGPSKIILGLKDTDFSSIVDLTGKTFGDFYLPVEVHSPLTNITSKGISPPEIKVSVEKLTTLTLPISVVFENIPKDFLPSMPVVSPVSANVVGPESMLSQVDKVYVSVDLTSITDVATFNLPVKIAMKEGTEPNNIYVNPSNCVVVVSKASISTSITVPIIPSITGNPLSGFGVKSLSIDPRTITLSGDYSKISNVQGVSIEPIDISNLSKTTTFNANIVIPEGAKSTINKCSVKIEVEPLKTVRIQIPIVILHDDTKLATSATDSVEITISGFADSINGIQAQSISATVDATNLDSGTYTLPITITNLPQNLILHFMNPTSCEVRIS